MSKQSKAELRRLALLLYDMRETHRRENQKQAA
jgi:hypothetical protein